MEIVLLPKKYKCHMHPSAFNMQCPDRCTRMAKLTMVSSWPVVFLKLGRFLQIAYSIHEVMRHLNHRPGLTTRPWEVRHDQLELEVLECRRGSKASSLQHAALPCVTIPAATTTTSPSAKGCHARSSRGTLAIKVTACIPGSPATP